MIADLKKWIPFLWLQESKVFSINRIIWHLERYLGNKPYFFIFFITVIDCWVYRATLYNHLIYNISKCRTVLKTAPLVASQNNKLKDQWYEIIINRFEDFNYIIVLFSVQTSVIAKLISLLEFSIRIRVMIMSANAIKRWTSWEGISVIPSFRAWF